MHEGVAKNLNLNLILLSPTINWNFKSQEALKSAPPFPPLFTHFGFFCETSEVVF